jgi:hypothetical protein
MKGERENADRLPAPVTRLRTPRLVLTTFAAATVSLAGSGLVAAGLLLSVLTAFCGDSTPAAECASRQSQSEWLTGIVGIGGGAVVAALVFLTLRAALGRTGAGLSRWTLAGLTAAAFPLLPVACAASAVAAGGPAGRHNLFAALAAGVLMVLLWTLALELVTSRASRRSRS